MEDPRPRKKMLAGRQRIYGSDTGFWLPETEDVEDSKPRPMMLAAGQISGSADRGSWLPEREDLWARQRILAARQRICGPDRGFWVLFRGPGEKNSRTGLK